MITTFSHLNESGSLWEFLSKLLKFGNNDIVGGVPLQGTGIVATYLTMVITITSMMKLIKMLNYPVVFVFACLVRVWISYIWASAILVALELLLLAMFGFSLSYLHRGLCRALKVKSSPIQEWQRASRTGHWIFK